MVLPTSQGLISRPGQQRADPYLPPAKSWDGTQDYLERCTQGKGRTFSRTLGISLSPRPEQFFEDIILKSPMEAVDLSPFYI